MILRRLRFSLRTLLFFALMVGAGGVLWLRWEPWQAVVTLRPGGILVSEVGFSSDGRFVLTHSSMGKNSEFSRTILWDRFGKELYRSEWCPSGAQGEFHSASFLNGSDYIFLNKTPFNSSMQLINTHSFKMVFPDEGVSKIVFSPNFKFCAALLRGHTRHKATVASYSLDTGDIRAAWDFAPGSDSDEPLPDICISRDGTWVLVVAHEYGQGHGALERLYLCNALTGEKKRVEIPDVPIEKVFFSTNGERFVVLAFKSFQVFDTASTHLIMKGTCDAWFQWSNSPADYVQLNTDNKSSVLRLSGTEPIVEALPDSVAMRPLSLNGQWLSWTHGYTVTVRDLTTGKDYSTAVKEIPARATVLNTSPSLMLFQNEPYVFFDTTRNVFHTYVRGLSPDGTRMYEDGAGSGRIRKRPTDEVVSTLPTGKGDYVEWSPDSQQFIRTEDNEARVYQRVRSDEPGALWWEPALWLTLFFAGGFFRSVWLGWRASRERGAA